MRKLLFRRHGALFRCILAVGLGVASGLHAAEEDQVQDSGDDTAAVMELAPLKVTAAGLTEVTEGTGSYTTGAARTATPLNLSPRETPQSISVVTQQRIEDQNLNTVLDVVNNTTGVAVNRYETHRAQFHARGFEINSLMIDNVPTIYEQPWSAGEVFSNLSMYDRVEVVRGANGLMTGAGDPSATINLVHKRASSKELAGSVGLSGGSWNTYGMDADVSGGLNESGSVRGRVALDYNDGDSWIDLMHNRDQTVYATMDVDIGERTVLWFGASHQDSDGDSPMWGGLPVWYSDGSATDYDRSKTTSATWSTWDSVYDNYFLNLEHRFDNGWQARLGYSHGDRDADSYLLYVYGDPSPAMATFPGSYKTETTQDDYSLTFDGPFSLLGRDHDAAFGYVYSNQVFDAQQRPALDGFGGIADFDAYDGDFPEPTWGALQPYEDYEVKQGGLYGAVRFNLADATKLIVGTRISSYEKTASSAVRDMKLDSQITPYIGVVQDLTDNLSAYASYTDIFLPQSERTKEGEFLDPVLGKGAEIGLKGEHFDGLLNTSLAIFRIKQDRLAVATGDTVNGTVMENAYEESEGATSEGFDLEVSGEILPRWNALAGYAQFELEDANGEKINTLYARKTLRLFTTYQFQGALERLTIGGGVNWQSAIYTEAINPVSGQEKIEQGAYSLVNLMARYDITPQLSAQLNANNVLDETYFDVFDAYAALTYGEPANVIASLKYRF